MTGSDNEIRITLEGRIDSDNATSVGEYVLSQLPDDTGCCVVLDMQKLEYISSAGLRSILRMKKKYPSVRIENVNTGVYEIFDITGFTQMMPVSRAYREVSVEGCEKIGKGANGILYRIDKDNVVKVYTNDSALKEIQLERQYAKQALIYGIPTAIPYDIVKVGNNYGSVFEMLDARTLTTVIVEDPSKLEWCVEQSVEILKKMHSTAVPDGTLPDFRVKFRSWIEAVKAHIPDEAYHRLCELSDAVPYDAHMIHGDYHTKNLMLLDDEVLLIDMETMATGNPVFEFAIMYDNYIGFSEIDHRNIFRFQGYDFDTGVSIWQRTLEMYYGTDDPEKLKKITDPARVIGYVRLMDHVIRHKGTETPKGLEELEFWTGKLVGVLGRVDKLTFDGE